MTYLARQDDAADAGASTAVAGPVPKRPRGRPRDETKHAAIMQAAAELFLEQGLAAISMDKVAERAGVSKRTVYAHFGSKEGLFEACTRWQSRERRVEGATLRDDDDARTALLRLTGQLMRLVFDPAVIATCRVVQHEAGEHPDVAAQFYRNGPRQSHAVVVELLARLVARGDLDIDDLNAAGWDLINLAFGTFRMRLMLGLIDHVPDAELDIHLARIVAGFLRIYGRP